MSETKQENPGPKASFQLPEGEHKSLQGIESWSFDIFQVEDDQLPQMVEKIFRSLNIFDNFPIDMHKFRAFVRSMVARYQPNPYHCFRHACDVLHAVYLMLTLTEGAQRLNQLEIFAVALAAVCHDVDHPGLTNAFLVAASDPIALRYNDKAVLESHHAATAFLTMRGHDNVNIMSSLDEPHQRHLRRLVLSCILATDMGMHAEIIGHFTARLSDPRPFQLSGPYTPPGPTPPEAPESNDEVCDVFGASYDTMDLPMWKMSARAAYTADVKPVRSDEASTSSSSGPAGDASTSQPSERKSPLPKYLLPPLSSSNDVVLYLQMIIKCADLSNVIKPFFLSKRWSALLLLEWFRQGDIERELGMRVSKFMDRDEPTTLMDMTCGCIDFVAKPMFEATAVLLPHLHDEALANLTLNRSLWNSFSTGGRRVSEVARNILGPFLPPPVTIDRIAEKFGEATVKMDGQSSLHYDIYLPGEKTSIPTAPLQLLPALSPVEQSSPAIQALPMDEHHSSLLALDPGGDKLQSLNKGSLKQDREPSILGGAAPLSLLRVNRNASIDSPSDGTNIDLRSYGTSRRNTLEDRSGKSSRKSSFAPAVYKGTGVTTDTKNVALDIHALASAQDSAWDNRRFWDGIRRHPKGKRLFAMIESRFWVSINILATFVAMFAGDFTKAILPKAADAYEGPILSMCLFIFILELVLLSILSQGYFLGFFFWLDLIGSVSLLTVITSVYSQNLVIARTGKYVKAMTRLSKSMQATPLSSMFPIAYILKLFHHRNEIVDDDEDEYFHVASSSKPSQVWTELSELTVQKLIIGLLLLIILSPFLRDETRDLGPVMSLNTLDEFRGCTTQFNASVDKVQSFNMQHGYNLVYLGIKGMCCRSSCGTGTTANKYTQIVPSKGALDGKTAARVQYRAVELRYAMSDSNRTEALYSIRSVSRTKHGLNMALTVIMLTILGAWSFVLSNDSNRLLIQPIERMVEIVKELSDDPVSFAAKANLKQPANTTFGQVMETRVVEAALVKIASLSKVALGDAGMDILSVNLKGGSEFNPMIPGKKIRACFGFCDIRNFTDATECLQEDVMMFVNKIADVVHNKVVFHQGFPNKNIGDAFLLVWKKSAADNTQKTRGTNSFADRALQSFLDIIQCIETSQTLAEYAMHSAIQKRMPGYKIHMGFGLHVGWAIEGAIGSAHKVDPSYLSPHVNVSSRLEAATKQYGVMMLISETVIAELTKSSLRHCCRKLDRITVKGSAEPIIIYTFDMPLFQQDLKGNPSDYRALFENAVDNYIDGNWSSALEKLEECLQLWPTDKPGHVLLNFMASHNYRIPATWKGYRELTEK